MGTHSAVKFTIGLVIVIAFVAAVALAQAIGQAAGGGFAEWLQ